MSKRAKQWARTARTHLKHVLGNRCVDCGAVDGLEFDCIRSCGHAHHGMDTSARMSFYRKQWRLGNLALRCSRCNALKADLTPEQWEQEKQNWFRVVVHTPPAHTYQVEITHLPAQNDNPF